jgi:hypothetical protein
MSMKIIIIFVTIIKTTIYFPRFFLRKIVFDFQEKISIFSSETIPDQKKILIKFLKKKKFEFLNNYIISKKAFYLDEFFKCFSYKKYNKILLIYIYAYLVNINEYKLALSFHNKIFKFIKKNSFFYYQICTLNKKNISYFRHYSKSLGFRFIYNFLLYRNEKNYIQSITRPFNQIFSKKLNTSKNDEKFSKYIANKKLIIIGPLKKKIHVEDKNFDNFLIIRFKNNNYLKRKRYLPNIIFMNGTASRDFFYKKDYILKKKYLQWLIYINETFYIRYNKKIKLVENRFADNTRPIIFNCFTELNLLQKTLLDLSLFSPQKVILLNFDLYLSKYTEIGYGIYNTLIKKKREINFSFNHNQIIMFDFINFFHAHKKISLDNFLKSIINKGKINYLETFENKLKKIN